MFWPHIGLVGLNVRLDPKTDRALNAMARRRRQSRSDIVRDALKHYTAANGEDASPGRPYDAWVDVIGIINSAHGPSGERSR
jgi:metal-responsive CopG/Arc/MetJ family transcriptional regulator